ncbi:MAG: hypothetical protein BAJALOKI3v1_330016 [Promethearchaeota archaeon]|nr:MAG: hypothetical protein BAJALOKI3v1_330016 [Candidatus Lokiarchaeota archaeon]
MEKGDLCDLLYSFSLIQISKESVSQFTPIFVLGINFKIVYTIYE